MRWCPQCPIRKLVLSEVLAHLVEAIDGPEGEFGDFNPAVVHGLGVHDYNHQVKTVLLETC